MFSNRRLLLFAVAIAIVTAALLLRPKPVLVEAASIKRGPLMVTVDEEGRTRVRSRFVVAAPVSGRLERITLDEGDAVAADVVVARLHPQPLDPRLAAEAGARLEAAEAARREAQAHVEQVRAALEQAQRSAFRSRRLASDGTISTEELELTNLQETSRQKELAAAQHAAERADFEVRAAQATLLASGAPDGNTAPDAGSAVEVRSPASGSVLRVFEESERVVAVGTPLLQIGDPNDLEIVVDVLSKEAVLIHARSKVLIEEWGGPQPLTARVRMVEPAGFTKTSALGVEEQRVNVIADFDQIPPTLGDNFRVEARIIVWQADDVLKVPASALFRHHDLWTVFNVEAGKARYRTVELGHLGTTEAEVTAGLSEGEMVIVHPSDLLKDGVRVTYEPD